MGLDDAMLAISWFRGEMTISQGVSNAASQNLLWPYELDFPVILEDETGIF